MGDGKKEYDGEKLARMLIRSETEKERMAYWLCRLIYHCNDENLMGNALSFLESIGYDEDRIQFMIGSAEPGSQ